MSKTASNMNNNKIGFLSLFSLVISAQLGASVFLMPSVLATFRSYGLIGWLSAGIGAVLITIVFSFLCTKTNTAGGPHIYAGMFFGKKVGFFVTWIYWCAAWACNPIMIATAINYLMSLTGPLDTSSKIALEILLVIGLTFINTKGIKTSGYFDLILNALKILPLIIIPIISIKYINFDNFSESLPKDMTSIEALTKATLLSFWGFVGLEGGTSPANSVKNAKRTIPLAIISGTSFVALICFINTFSIFGVIPPSELESIGAPFAEIMTRLFAGSSDKLVGLITFIMCAGSLNAWVLFSGQISKSAADKNIFPKMFNKLNKNGAPSYSLWISALGTISILFLQKTDFIGDKIVKFLDMSVIVYIALYTIAILSYIKFSLKNKANGFFSVLITILALSFCLFIMIKSDVSSFIALLIMIATGIPVFINLRKKEK